MTLLAMLARDAKVGVLIAESDAETLLRAQPVLYLRDGKLVNPETMAEGGRVYRFPAPQARRAALDA
jgi:hypothetical protein